MGIVKYCLMLFSLNINVVILENVPDAFRNTRISPEVIKTPPHKLLQVVYGEDIVVNLGTRLTAVQVVNQPSVSFQGCPSCYYTLVMIDPDALYPGFLNLPGQFLHWIVGNIKGSKVSTGQVVAPYLSPTPPPLSDPHRYIFLLYQHDHVIDYNLDDYLTTTNRPIFFIDQFVEKHNLNYLVFGNYFNGVFL